MSLENQVAGLTTETTNLLDAVNVKKATLDGAVDSASNSASSASSDAAAASSSATTAQNAEGQTLIYRDEAEQFRNDAAAVVTGGTATLIPEAGKIPLADANGQVDHNWLGGEYIAHLMATVSAALDLAGQAGREVLPSQTVEQILQSLALASDLAGQAARAVGGGEVLLRSGSPDSPSLSRPEDRDTGLFFPAPNAVAVSVSGVEALRADPGGRVGIGTSTPSGKLDVDDDRLRVRQAKTPASAVDSGNTGEIAWDANYLYVCTATNTWKRVALASW